MADDAPPCLAALVVTHNRLDQLRITVARLLSETVDHVAVVDNGSSDGTAAWLATQSDPRVIVLRLEDNRGGAGGFAHGMAHLQDHVRPDWMVLMDDDARPLPGAIGRFRALDLAAWDAVAAGVWYPDGTVCEMNRPVVNRWSGPFVPGHINAPGYAGAPRPISASSFVGFFVTREAVAQIGYPDPDLFLYMDDGLYTLGLTRAGFRLGFAPEVRFEHDCQTLTTRRTGFTPVWKAYYYHRNLLIFYREAMGPLFWPVFTLYLLPRWLWKVRDQSKDKRVFLNNVVLAVRDGFRNRRETPIPIQQQRSRP